MAHILLADPVPESRRALSRLLQGAGFTVQTVATGADAIIECEIRPPDILIMDVDLPDMDGFEACHHARCETRDHDVTIILMTDANNEMMRNSLGQMVDFAGGDFFFARPFDGRLLVHLLEDLEDEDDDVCGTRQAGSPTRVVWPSARARPDLASPCLG
jgi:CheY-like chemotaxis protein